MGVAVQQTPQVVLKEENHIVIALTGLERGLQHVKALMAIKAGVDYLVVGRPILAAADPRAATQAIAAEIESAIK